MKTGIALALLGGILGLIGPLLLPFVTILEHEGPNIPGYRTLPGVLGAALAVAALLTVALLARRRRLQGLGGVLAALALGEFGLMAWTWADVWSLIPCEESGLALCDASSGALVAETLVRLDWGVGASLLGGMLLLAGGVLVLLAHPEFGRSERFLRVRLGWQGTTLAEAVAFRRRIISLGESDSAMLRVPARGLGHHLLFVPLDHDPDGWRLTAPAVGVVEVIRGDGVRALRPGEHLDVRRGDSGVIRLDDDLSVSFDFMAAETAVLGGTSQGVFDLLAPLTAVALLAFAVLLGSALSAKRGRGEALAEDLARHAKALVEVAFIEPPKEVEPEPEVLPLEPLLQAQRVAKKAEGEEGRFGRPDAKTTAESRAPRRDAALRDVDVEKIGVVDALRRASEVGGALAGVLAPDGAIERTLAVASAGEGGDIVIGPGSGGTGWRNTGRGGGGPAGYGRIRALGEVDLGDDVGRRSAVRDLGKKRRAPVPQVVRQDGRVAGGFCDPGDIRSKVRQKAAALRGCYEAELLNRPDLQGKVTAQWTIDGEGKAQSPRIIESKLGAPAVEDCVLRVLGRLRFAAPDAGVCVVQWPFVFSGG